MFFSKMFLVLILTIIDDYKSLLFFVLFITACYNDVSLHELHLRQQKSHNDKLYITQKSRNLAICCAYVEVS